MRRKWIFLAPAAILGVLLFVAIGGEVVMLLWNWLVPAIFGWPQITFWQAVGLLALCRILFGGHGYRRSRAHTAEERERFRQGIRRRFGFNPTTSESKGQ
jgi:hypothetical protein